MIVPASLQKIISKYSKDTWLITSVLISLVFATIFSLIAVHRFWQYESWYYDFGIFGQAIYSVSRFEAPIIDHFVVPGKTIFADHFHPIIFVLSPLFWFTNKPEILLVAQSLLAGLSGIFIFLTAKIITKNNFLAMCLLILYFSFIGLHFALISEFHEVALLPLPLTIFFYALVTKKVRLYVVAAVVVLLVKESTFIIPAFFCLMESIKSKGTWRKINVIMMFVSLAYGAAVIKLIIPYFSQGAYQYTGSEKKGLSSLQNLFDSPLKIKTMWQTLASYGFLPLLSPELLPPVLVNWYTRFSLPSVSRHGLAFHYNAEVAPTLLFSSILAVQRLQKWIQKEMVVNAGVAVITLWCVFYSVIVMDSPIRLAVIPDFYKHSQTFEFLDRLVEKVPNEGSVMAQANLTPRFIDQHVKMLRDDYENYSPDWIVIDTRDGQNPNNFYGVSNPEDLFAKLEADTNYEVYYQQGEQFIYKKVN